MTFQDLSKGERVALLRSDVQGFNALYIQWRVLNSHKFLDLSGADLRGTDISGAFLVRSDLSGANLRDADMRGANLHKANLSHANLRDAKFSQCAHQLMQVIGLEFATEINQPLVAAVAANKAMLLMQKS
jgi:uncharacterized protein YjbI with pentapeptide repeats